MKPPTNYICRNCLQSLRNPSKSIHNALHRRLSSSSSPTIPSRPFRLAIVGSGPAGFYAASRVLREHNQTVIDMYERLPVPFGLVRFGVAPDHPEVKNCQERFEEIAALPNFNFIGNVQLGKDLELAALRPHYDAVLFAYGASKDRLLGVQGEDIPQVLSAREFVAWYNGLPGFADLNPAITKSAGGSNQAVIVGQGNVALDVARMLLEDVDTLRKTDTPEPVLETLSRNVFKTVKIVGRRGPCQAAFTIKEIRELTKSNRILAPVQRSFFPSDLRTLPRARRRIAELLIDPNKGVEAAPNRTDLHFFASPHSFEADKDGNLTSALFSHTRFVGNLLDDDPARFLSDTRVEIDGTAKELETIDAGIAFRSIGYKAEPIPGLSHIGVPFDTRRGVIPNESGRVVRSTDQKSSSDDRYVPGMYATGWVKRGPTGVIATTMADAFETADAIVADIKASQQLMTHIVGETDGKSTRLGWDALRSQVASNVRPVSWRDWQYIDAVEKERGAKLGKPREKFTSVAEMLRVLDG